MRLRVFHTTRYQYPTPASDSHNEAKLMPLSDRDQTCLDFRLTTSPAASIFAYDLPSGRVHHFNLRARHQELVISAESLVVTYRHNPFKQLPLVADDMAFYMQPKVRENYYEYLLPTRRVPLTAETDRIAAVARKQAGTGTASLLISLTRQLHRAFAYTPGATTVNTSLQQVLENKQGVCQDFAHLMLSVCRRQGIPARYVSGYLYTGQRAATEVSETNAGRRTDDYASQHASTGISATNAGRRTDDESNTDESNTDESNTDESNTDESNTDDSTARGLVSGNAMHAWVECLMPDDQWHGFDPTNNLVTNDYYVKVHHGRDYGDVPPVRGLYRGPFAHALDVSVQVIREPDR